MSKTNNRVALYARVSTTSHGQDVGLQLDELRQSAKLKGMSIVEEFIDEGISGTQERRPALDRMMAAATAKKLDVVMVWRFDRFARSTTHLLQALEQFRVLGVEFVSLREQIDTGTALGKAMYTIAACMGEMERELIVERVKAGVARAKAQGTHCGRPRRDLDLRAATLLLDQGHSVRAVAAMLGLPRGTLRRRLQEAGSEVTAPATS